MHISKIQSTMSTHNQYFKRANNTLPPQVPVDKSTEVNFKGSGKGMIGGLGTGLATGLLVVGGAAIAGVVALPAIVGGIAVLATGAAGAYAGDKIEDKIKELKDKKSSNSDK